MLKAKQKELMGPQEDSESIANEMGLEEDSMDITYDANSPNEVQKKKKGRQSGPKKAVIAPQSEPRYNIRTRCPSKHLKLKADLRGKNNNPPSFRNRSVRNSHKV